MSAARDREPELLAGPRTSRTSVGDRAGAARGCRCAEPSASPSSLREQLGEHAAERAALGDLRDLLGRGVPEQDAAVRVGGDDGVGDAPEDRRDAILLVCDRLVEQRVAERHRGGVGERRQCLDLVVAQAPRVPAEDRQHALHAAVGTRDRRAGPAREAGHAATGSSGASAAVGGEVVERHGPGGREHLGREHVADREPLAAEALDRRALGRAQRRARPPRAGAARRRRRRAG